MYYIPAVQYIKTISGSDYQCAFSQRTVSGGCCNNPPRIWWFYLVRILLIHTIKCFEQSFSDIGTNAAQPIIDWSDICSFQPLHTNSRVFITWEKRIASGGGKRKRNISHQTTVSFGMCLQDNLDESSRRIPSPNKVTNKTQTNTTRFIHLPAHHSKIVENEPPSTVCIINCNISWMLREKHEGKNKPDLSIFDLPSKNSLSLSSFPLTTIKR